MQYGAIKIVMLQQDRAEDDVNQARHPPHPLASDTTCCSNLSRVGWGGGGGGGGGDENTTASLSRADIIEKRCKFEKRQM